MGLFHYIHLGCVREMRERITEDNQPGAADLQTVRNTFLIRKAALSVTVNLDRVLCPRSGGEKDARDEYLHWRLAQDSRGKAAGSPRAVWKRSDFNARVAYPLGGFDLQG